MSTIALDDFSGGLRTDVSANNVPPNGLSEATNVEIVAGGVRPARGRKRHSTVKAQVTYTLPHLTALVELTSSSDAISTRLVAGRASFMHPGVFQDLIASAATDGALAANPIECTAGFSGTTRLALTAAADSVYATDGTGSPVKFLGLPDYPVATASIGDLQGTTLSGGVSARYGTEGPAGVARNATYIAVCDKSNRRLVLFNSTTGEYVLEAALTTTGYPLGVIMDATDAFVLVSNGTPAVSYHVHKVTLATGLTAATYAAHGTGAGQVNNPTDIAWDGAAASATEFYVVDGTKAEKYNKTGTAGTAATCADSLTYVADGGSSGGVYFGNATKWYTRSVNTIASGVVWPTGVTPTGMCYNGTDSRLIAAMSATAICSINTGTGAGTTYRLPYSDDVKRGGTATFGTFGRIAFYDAGTRVPYMYVVADPSFNRVLLAHTAGLVSEPTAPLTVAQVLTGPDSATRAPSVTPTYTPQTLPVGTYEFCTVYRCWNRDGFYESAPSPIATLNSQGGTWAALTISMSAPATFTSLLDTVKLYVRDPTTGGNFLFVKEEPIIAAGTTFTLPGYNASTGYTVEGAALLNEWDARPPVGVTFTSRFGLRMLYAKGDMVYVSHEDWVSNYHGLDLVPTDSPFDSTPWEIGGSLQVGRDGAPVIGAAMVNGVMAVTKKRGLWKITGARGETAFGLYPVSNDVGCVSGLTMRECEGVLLWLDQETVWAFDGERLQEVGRPLRDALRAEAATATNLAQAFAVYDPVRHWYTVYVPTYGGTLEQTGTECQARAYRYQLAEKCWVKLTGQPGACAVYCRSLSVPGVYAGDWYATSLGAVYQCDTTGSLQGAAGSTPTAQAWTFTTAAFSDLSTPYRVDPGTYKHLRQVRVTGQGRAASLPLTLGVRLNGATSATTTGSITLPNAALGIASAKWSPPCVSNARAIAITVSGSTNEATDPIDEVQDITLDLLPKGRY